MGQRIRKEIGKTLPISVIISMNTDEQSIRDKAIKWCNSSPIKHPFHVSLTRNSENEISLIARRMFNELDISSIYPTMFTSFTMLHSYTKVYVTFRFQDRRDAALFKLFWG